MIFAGALLCAVAAARAQAPVGAPQIDKIDPPKWRTGLPDPLLLVKARTSTVLISLSPAKVQLLTR
jgi:hypothetical protein